MKNLIYSLVFVFLLSCKSSTPLVSYILNNDNDNEVIVVFEDKIQKEQMQSGIKNKLILDSLNNINYPFKKHYKEINNLAFNYKYKSNKWTNSDFKKIQNKIIILSSDSTFFKKSEMIKEDIRNFYSFSDLYYDKNKKYVTFYASIANGWKILFSGVVTMQNKNKKWEIINLIENKELY